MFLLCSWVEHSSVGGQVKDRLRGDVMVGIKMVATGGEVEHQGGKEYNLVIGCALRITLQMEEAWFHESDIQIEKRKTNACTRRRICAVRVSRSLPGCWTWTMCADAQREAPYAA